eukprot:scaffold1982_cov358-Pavlova_lutheri.AAC.6
MGTTSFRVRVASIVYPLSRSTFNARDSLVGKAFFFLFLRLVARGWGVHGSSCVRGRGNRKSQVEPSVMASVGGWDVGGAARRAARRACRRVQRVPRPAQCACWITICRK